MWESSGFTLQNTKFASTSGIPSCVRGKHKEYAEDGVHSPAMVHHGTLRWIGKGWQKKEVKLKRRGLGKDPTAAAWGWALEVTPPISQDPSLDNARTYHVRVHKE